ncbi:hypothetical protein B5P44_15635 [Mycobacterium sp. CBMA 213]|nr:hypothetical protein [Mycolicibacterium sp. CBMA 213]
MFGIGVVGHVARQSMAEQLASTTEADYLSLDDGRLGPGANHCLVWSRLATLNHEWTVVLEDDALPVAGFRDQLSQALGAEPASVVSLYLGQQRPPQHQVMIANALAEAEACQAHWITSTYLLHAVAVAIKTELVPDMLANLPALPIDEAIGDWARSRGHQIAYSVPSLVDHADLPTLVNHPDGQPRQTGRVAWQVGGRTHWNGFSVAL